MTHIAEIVHHYLLIPFTCLFAFIFEQSAFQFAHSFHHREKEGGRGKRLHCLFRFALDTLCLVLWETEIEGGGNSAAIMCDAD